MVWVNKQLLATILLLCSIIKTKEECYPVQCDSSVPYYISKMWEISFDKYGDRQKWI